MQTYEEQRAFVSKLNVIDDVFFQKMAEDKDVCEEILRIILEKPDLVVIESQERVTEMCQLVEEYAEEKVKEEAIKTAMNLQKQLI